MRAYQWKLSILVGLAWWLGCAAPTIIIEEPVGDAFLVIGAVIVEDDYYTKFPGVVKQDIEVAILAEIEENGVTKTTGYWAKTDENGYFYLLNVPPGKYALAGVRLFLSDQKPLVIANPLTDENSIYQIKPEDHLGFIGNYFDILPRGKVVNLQTNYLSVDAESRTYYDVKYLRRKAFSGLRLVDGRQLDLMPAEKYFLYQFAGTGWIEMLRPND